MEVLKVVEDLEFPSSSSCLDEYQKLVISMNNTPRVSIDNSVSPTATLVKVDSARKHGILLEAIQALTDLNLSINKAYISSDGRWFMDVFHVTDLNGNKLTEDSVVSFIEHSLGAGNFTKPSSSEGLTTLELIGADRPGLLSEVFAVLADLHCSVADAKVWTHNGRIAAVILLSDDDSPIPNSHKAHSIEARLRQVLQRDHDERGARVSMSSTAVLADRRLHQLMLADGDYSSAMAESAPLVSVQNWVERGYSVINIDCEDRPKLLFDIICTLTEMKYIVFHGTIDTEGDRARQELYIKHSDGNPITSEAERNRVIQSLQAAIERRSSKGSRLELRAEDRRGLLAEVTRAFREHGMLVRRAEISTEGEMASNVFYVTDLVGCPVDPKGIDAVRQGIGMGCLKVKEEPRPRSRRQDGSTGISGGGGGAGLFYLGSLVLRCLVLRNLDSLGLVRSCS